MPALLPNRFLIRLAHPCPYWAKMPLAGDRVVDLPESARLNNFAELDGAKNFADLRLAWNELGLGVQMIVTGKETPPSGDAEKPRSSDGLTLWLDTRDARSSHRASRYCHQFHFLPNGGQDSPWCGQTKISRALADAPLAKASDIPFRSETAKGGYRLEAFLPLAALAGFDPEQYPRLGVYYVIHDADHGEQTLSVNADFPYWDDPSLWSVLEMVK